MTTINLTGIRRKLLIARWAWRHAGFNDDQVDYTNLAAVTAQQKAVEEFYRLPDEDRITILYAMATAAPA